MPECQKIKNSGLHQYGAEHFGRLIFCHSQKTCETERVNMSLLLQRLGKMMMVLLLTSNYYWCDLLSQYAVDTSKPGGQAEIDSKPGGQAEIDDKQGGGQSEIDLKLRSLLIYNNRYGLLCCSGSHCVGVWLCRSWRSRTSASCDHQ